MLRLLATPYARWAILGLHLLLLLGIYLHQGILLDKEAQKYLGCAADILAGDLRDITGNYLKYGAYVLFLVPFVAADVLPLAILAQIVLGILAGIAVSRMVQRLTGHIELGNLALAVLLLCYPVQVWALALYTESFFTSVSVLFVERISRTGARDRGTWGLGALTLFARPVGIFFVGPCALWSWTRTLSDVQRSFIRWAGCAVLLAVAVYIPGIKPAQLAPIVEGHVIAGVPEQVGPGPTFVGSSIADAQHALFDRIGPIRWVDLFVRRVCSLFTLHRPYYSVFHNVTAGLFYLLYPMALIGFWRFRSAPLVKCIAATLVLYTILIGLTHDEWSGRFLVPLMPWIVLMAVSAFPDRSVAKSG